MVEMVEMAGIADGMATTHQMLGLGLTPMSTICRGGRKMVEMVEMGGRPMRGMAEDRFSRMSRNIAPD
jgi:hypothetical protein